MNWPGIVITLVGRWRVDGRFHMTGHRHGYTAALSAEIDHGDGRARSILERLYVGRFGSCLDETNSLGPSSTRVEEASSK